MGEARQVTVNSGGTPAEAPDAPEVIATTLDAHRVSIPTDQSGESESESVAEEGERPDWLPEKFKSSEDLAKAYEALERKQGNVVEEEEEAVEEAAPAGAPGSLSNEQLQPFYDEYSESGELKEDSFKALEKLGLDKALVQSFMEGQKAMHEAAVAKLYGLAGGQEEYAKAIEWASTNVPQDELKVFNKQVDNGDMAEAQSAVQGMLARYQQSGVSGSKQPKLLQSEPVGPGGPAPYESIQQLMKDMKSEDYKNDLAFRAKVQEKLARSNIM